jgi:hypothetical protein
LSRARSYGGKPAPPIDRVLELFNAYGLGTQITCTDHPEGRPHDRDLGEARAVMQSLPGRRQHREPWLYTGALSLEAASANGSLNIAREQLMRALEADVLI